ncbi:MAG: nitrilase-related carbon-nitrogen hydrolase [Dehalococcoidia bacterium]
MRYRVALLQMEIATGEVEANLAKFERMAEEARSLGADLVLTPEILTTGYGLKGNTLAGGRGPALMPGKPCAKWAETNSWL